MITGRSTTHTGRAAHWDTVYDTKGEDGVSWYQSTPTITLELLTAAGIDRHASIIDLGGGASVVVDHLLAGGFTDISVLDVSRVALDRTRARLGTDAERIHWLHRDIFDWVPERRYDLWHDRAVFHFLIDEDERRAYLRTLHAGLAPGGRAIVATFDADGPTHCSGLPVVRYRAEDLATVFAPHLDLVTSRREEHLTPAGLIQPFTWVLLTAADHDADRAFPGA
jgi:trans-aconitate methyltransferase